MIGDGVNEAESEYSLSPTRGADYESSMRRRTADEVLESERKYLAQLRLLTEYFVEPLSDGKILSGADAAAIFSNVVQIKSVSETLLMELQRTSVGEAFVSLCPFLKQYALYASNYQRAMHALTSLSQKQGPFVEFLRRQECRPELGGLKLISLLITPVQRVPRYKLLLERLLKHTDASVDTESAEKLKDAVRQVAEVTEYVNQQVSVYASMHRAVEIQRCLSSAGDGSRAIELLKPWRALLKEGVLYKVSQKSGRSSQRSVFLFTDVLMYARTERGGGYSHVVLLELKHLYTSRGATAAVSSSGSKWSGSSGSIGSSSSARCSTDKQLQSRALQVSCKEKKLLLFAQRETEAIAWFNAIQTAVSQCRQCLQSLRRAARPGSGLGTPVTTSAEPVAASTQSAVGTSRETGGVTRRSASKLCAPPATKAEADQTLLSAEAETSVSDLSKLSPNVGSTVTVCNSPATDVSGEPRAAPRRGRRRPLVSTSFTEQGESDALSMRNGNQISATGMSDITSSSACSSTYTVLGSHPVADPVRIDGQRDVCMGCSLLDNGHRKKQNPCAPQSPVTVVSGDASTCRACCASMATTPVGDGMDTCARLEWGRTADVTAEAYDKRTRKSKWKKRCDFLVKAGQILSQVVTSPILPSPQPPLFSPGLHND